MRTYIHFLLFVLLFSFVVIGCDDEGEEAGETEEATTTTTEESTEVDPSAAVCLWNKAALREAAGKDGKYSTSVVFGEQVEMLGETKKVDEENRTYMKVRLSDGSEGWVNQYLFAGKSKLGIILQSASLYNRPDLMTQKSSRMEAGELVIVSSKHAEWVKVSTADRKKSGWISGDGNISKENADITLALMYHQALQSPIRSKQLGALESLTKNSSFSSSPMMKIVKAKYQALSEMGALPETQLYVVGSNVNVRASATTASDVVMQLSDGNLCEVLQKGKKERLGNMNDYWYKIEYQGQIGWIYGYFTSKRL